MPIQDTSTTESFDGNGSTTTPYPLTLQRDRDEDIKLSVGGVVSTDFTIAPDGIRTGTAIPSGTAVIAYRVTPLSQEQTFPSNTTPAAEDVRAALDKATLMIQELANRITQLET